MKLKQTRRKKLVWSVTAAACAMILFLAFSSAQERHDLSSALSQIPLPDYFNGLFDDYEPETGSGSGPAAVEKTQNAGVQVHFIDVGQGKSILITAPEKNVLIDAGESNQGGKVLRYLAAKEVGSLDAVIGTHPHSDHIGGLSDVISGITVRSVLLPVIPDELVPTSSAYTRLLQSIAGASLKITPAEPGVRLDLGDGAKLTILGPLEGHDYQDLNNYSVVGRLDYGGTSFLFTGDASEQAEYDMHMADENLRASVLDVAHHGSKSSTGAKFLKAVNPGVAVISCGVDNSYGHPHSEVMKALKERGVTILRTDLDGSVVIYSDGESLGIETEKGQRTE